MKEEKIEISLYILLVTGLVLETSASGRFFQMPCSAPLGLRHRHYDPTLTFDLWASSGDAGGARLNSKSAWEPKKEKKHFLLIKSSRPVLLTGLETQGRPGAPDRVNGWLLETSADCENYHAETYTSGGEISNGTFLTKLNHPEFASCIRIWPTKFIGENPALRLELLGCVVSEHSRDGCSKEKEYNEHIDENVREIYFWQEKVLAWLKVRLPQQMSREMQTVYVFYSRSCNGEDWTYLEPAEVESAWVPSADDRSIWNQLVLQFPVRVKCLRVICDRSSSVEEVLTNECSSSPLASVYEMNELSKGHATLEHQAGLQSLGIENNDTKSMPLEKQVLGIFDEYSDANEKMNEHTISQEADLTNSSKINFNAEVPLNGSDERIFSNHLQEIMFSNKPEEKSPLLDQTPSIDDYFHIHNLSETSSIFRETEFTASFEQLNNNEAMSNEWSPSNTAAITRQDVKKKSYRTETSQREPKPASGDIISNNSPKDLTSVHTSVSSSQEFKSIAQTQLDFDTLMKQSDNFTVSGKYQNVFNPHDDEIKSLHSSKLRGDSSSHKIWIKKKSLRNPQRQKERKVKSIIKNKECGVKAHHEGSRWKRVVAGEPNTLGQWPWLVSLHYLPFFPFTNQSGYKHLCGGSLISPEWIVSAAHCFEVDLIAGLEKVTNWEVKVGINDLAGEEDDPGFKQERLIETVYKHPDYRANNSNYENDIALLKLDRPVYFTDVVSSVCLNGAFEDVARHCLVSGWGQLTANSSGARFAHTTSIQTVTLRDCNATFEGLKTGHPAKAFFNRIDENVLCTQIGSNGEDACQGDSGSPLMCEHEGRWYLTGIVSAGYECGNPLVPAIYTRVSHFVDWIEETTKLTIRVDKNGKNTASEHDKSGAMPHF